MFNGSDNGLDNENNQPYKSNKQLPVPIVKTFSHQKKH